VNPGTKIGTAKKLGTQAAIFNKDMTPVVQPTEPIIALDMTKNFFPSYLAATGNLDFSKWKPTIKKDKKSKPTPLV